MSLCYVILLSWLDLQKQQKYFKIMQGLLRLVCYYFNSGVFKKIVKV